MEKVIARERPDALLPTLGGQTALNLAMELHERGTLAKYGVELIGAGVEAIKKGEDRELFQAAMKKIGVETARGKMVHSMDEAVEYQKELGLPVVIRPSFTLGGTGGGIAHTYEEFLDITAGGLRDSPVTSVLLEESILGWKEYELEVMRDTADTVIIITGIENFDPMGVHTGDSITVAPAQTLSDVEYQRLRDMSLAIIREIGVATGGSNIQFCGQPRQRARDRDRDEPARVALLGAGEQGHRLSDCQDRRAAGGGLPPRRAAQRHHPRHARVV